MKGLSPIVGVVILIAFTVAIGGLFLTFSTDFLSGTTSTVSQQIEEVVDCGDLNLKIQDVSCNEDNFLLGMWHFEDSGTTSKDFSPAGNTMNFTSAPASVEGHDGQGVQFDGTNYGAVANSESLTPEKFSIEMWVYRP